MLALPTMDIPRTLVIHGFHKKIYIYTRNEIAAKLQQGVSKEKILDNMQNNVGTEFLHDHIIDKQDVINIQCAYGLEEVQRHADDQTSALAWIQEWQNSTSNPVVWYKLQGIFF